MTGAAAKPDAEKAARLWRIAQPLIVGVTGQRFFAKGSCAENRRLYAEAQERFEAVVERLDRDFPNTPKLLVTGGAMGADLVAAEAARAAGPLWRVVFLLALSPDLFREDFTPPPNVAESERAAWEAWCTEQRDAFQQFVEGGAAVRVLPGLQTADGPADRARLSRSSPGYDKGLRRAHYEQVGLWLAENATLLVAIGDAREIARESARRKRIAPKPKQADGGTPRVVAHRRFGHPDREGAAVARMGEVARHDWPAARPAPSRSAWVIDPGRPPPPGSPSKAYPVHAFKPIDPPGRRRSHRGGPYAAPVRGSHASLRLARAFDGFARDLRDTSEAGSDVAPGPVSRLKTVRGILSAASGAAKTKATRAFAGMAGAFLLAVLLFEIFAKFMPSSPWPLAAYLAVILGVGLTVLYVGFQRWQPRFEDYRAVSELLRVQIAWWNAGLPDRIDRVHLQGADRDLARIRDGLTAIVAYAWLLGDWEGDTPGRSDAPRRAWAEVRSGRDGPRLPRPPEQKPSDWVGGQLAYFFETEHDREHDAERAERMSWFLFITSGFLAGLILLWLAVPAAKVLFLAAGGMIGIAGVISGLGLAALLAWQRDRVGHDLRSFRPILLSGAFALFTALALGLAVAALGHVLDPYLPKLDAETATKYAAIVLVVLVNAGAGAWRYLAEKLGYEAEALAYRDAYRAFATAEKALAAIWDPGADAPRDEPAAREIVRALGRVALEENEAWLKTRRERPLTPVAG